MEKQHGLLIPDLNLLDFYLWGHLKYIVYDTEVSDVQDLQQVRQSLFRCATSCTEAQGEHFEHFL